MKKVIQHRWSATSSGRSNPNERSICALWMGQTTNLDRAAAKRKFLAPTGNRTPGLRQWLYWLSYPCLEHNKKTLFLNEMSLKTHTPAQCRVDTQRGIWTQKIPCHRSVRQYDTKKSPFRHRYMFASYSDTNFVDLRVLFSYKKDRGWGGDFYNNFVFAYKGSVQGGVRNDHDDKVGIWKEGRVLNVPWNNGAITWKYWCMAKWCRNGGGGEGKHKKMEGNSEVDMHGWCIEHLLTAN